MTWKLDDPQGNEAGKVKYDIVPYTRGVVLDLGCGPFKAFPHFIGVDNGHHAKEFGWQYTPDIAGETCEILAGEMTREVAKRLGIEQFEQPTETVAGEVIRGYARIPDASVDAVFSSHLLEHIEDTDAALAEWWRVIKPGGYLVLYLPHKDLYPNIGTEGANPDHKHDFTPADIGAAMAVGDRSWDLKVNEVRSEGYEYSFLQVFQKREVEVGERGTAIVRLHSWRTPRPEKTALVVRFGGIGDMIMASSILPQLKAKGYHVTMMTTPRGEDVVKHDPNIDAFLIQDTDQVPNTWLCEHFHVWAKKFNRFVNLCESVEGNLLPLPGSSRFGWPDAMRQKYLNVNYLEFTHELAGLDFKPAPRFFATEAERERVANFRRGLGDAYVVMWCLAGSSAHKTYPHTDQAVATLMLKHPNIRVIFVGDDACRILEGQWEGEDRVARLSGKIGVRETLALACHGVDCVVGPETGVLNAVSHLKLPKVVMLSHSSVKNLTKHWVNTVSLSAGPLEAPCFPCHRLHHDRTFCPSFKIPVEQLTAELAAMDEQDRALFDEHTEGGKFDTGAALCAHGIPAQRVVAAVMAAQPKRILVPA